jgi:hypothetical protein
MKSAQSQLPSMGSTLRSSVRYGDGEPGRRVAYRPRRRPCGGRVTISIRSARPKAKRRSSASSASRWTGQSAPRVTDRTWRAISSDGTRPVWRRARASSV